MLFSVLKLSMSLGTLSVWFDELLNKYTQWQYLIENVHSIIWESISYVDKHVYVIPFIWFGFCDV